MNTDVEERHGRTIRLLLVVTVLLGVTAGVEAWAIRHTRADLQSLRHDCDVYRTLHAPR